MTFHTAPASGTQRKTLQFNQLLRFSEKVKTLVNRTTEALEPDPPPWITHNLSPPSLDIDPVLIGIHAHIAFPVPTDALSMSY